MLSKKHRQTEIQRRRPSAVDDIQLSPEGEVNSGGYIPRREASRHISTDPEGDSCFSIYQIRWIKRRFFNFFFSNFRETTCHFSLRTQSSEYPRIFQVMGANQNARKLLSTDLLNTNRCYLYIRSTPVCRCGVDGRCFYST